MRRMTDKKKQNKPIEIAVIFVAFVTVLFDSILGRRVLKFLVLKKVPLYSLTYSRDWPRVRCKSTAENIIINLLWLQCVYHVWIIAACKLRWPYLYFYLFLYLLLLVMTSSSDILMNKELLLPMTFYKRSFLPRTLKQFASLAWKKRHATKHYLITPHKTLNS